MSKRSNWSLLSIAGVVFALGVNAPLAQVGAADPVIYRLDPGSEDSFICTQGKFCVCPQRPAFPIRGTFTLTPAGSDDLFAYYAVSDVDWLLVDGDISYRTTGSGQYKLGVGSPQLQELDLDLTRSGGQATHYSSGLVPVLATFPEIAITIADGGSCVIPEFIVQARPVPQEEIRPFVLLENSRFVRQCAEPCQADEVRPIRGTFALVPLLQDSPFANPPSTAFAAVSLAWGVERPSGPEIPVNGLGIYTLVLGVPTRQRLSLDLQFGAQPTSRFDSGLVPGGGDPSLLDIMISADRPGAVDASIDLHAARPAAP